METALGLSGGVVVLDFVDLPEGDPHRERMFSEHLACLYDDLSFEELEPRSFSFNSPWGACPDCTGLGTRMEADPGLVVPDPGRTLAEGAIGPWNGGPSRDYFSRLIEALGAVLGFGMDTPWSRLPAAAQDALLHGYPEPLHVRFTTARGRERSYDATFEGAIPFIERRHAEAESDAGREQLEGFMREVPCPACQGTRLKPIARAVTVAGRSIAELCALPVADLAAGLPSPEPDRGRRADRGAHPGRDQQPARVPAGHRPGLPVPGPVRPHAGGRGGAADPAGHPDRVGAGGGAVCAG